MNKITKLALLFTVSLFAQYKNKDGNRIGISGGVTHTSLTTNNFKTSPSIGWIGGLAVRGNYYNNWSAVFGMQFTDSNFILQAASPSSLTQIEDVNVKLSAVQVRLLLSYNVIKDHVSIDLGPVLQINGQLSVADKDKKNVLPLSPAVKVEDLLEVNKINGNAYIGFSAGTKRVRAVVFYQYGFNNFLSNLNKNDDLVSRNNNKMFEGHLGFLSGQLLFNL
ncbi:MAG: hypothetical protein QM535_03165 [Limnohabitans sp.]|nr:hypothetical protein [Limnohabitans sp.]